MNILNASRVTKNPPAMHKMRVRSLGWKDPLEKERPPTSSVLDQVQESHGQRSLVGYSPWVAKSQT